MTHKISDLSATYGPHTLESLPGERVNFCVLSLDGAMLTATMDRYDFLDVVSSELGITILDSADVPALITTADLNATHLGKHITVTSPEGWEATGVLYSAEHTAPQVDVGTLKELDPQWIPGRPATVLEVGPFQFEATGTETVRVHS